MLSVENSTALRHRFTPERRQSSPVFIAGSAQYSIAVIDLEVIDKTDGPEKIFKRIYREVPKQMKSLPQLLQMSQMTLTELSLLSGIDVSDLSKAMRGQLQLSKFDVFLLRRTLTLRIAQNAGELERLVHA